MADPIADLDQALAAYLEIADHVAESYNRMKAKGLEDSVALYLATKMVEGLMAAINRSK